MMHNRVSLVFIIFHLWLSKYVTQTSMMSFSPMYYSYDDYDANGIEKYLKNRDAYEDDFNWNDYTGTRHRHHHKWNQYHHYHAGGKKVFRSVSDMVLDHDEVVTHWPVKKEVVVEGNVLLGGLMMVHERENTMTCGPIMPQGGVQALEAMLYTLDRVNKEKLLPNVTVGALILDDCDKDTYGLEMAVDFIKG